MGRFTITQDRDSGAVPRSGSLKGIADSFPLSLLQNSVRIHGNMSIKIDRNYFTA
jgi:hypothetical protein